MIDQDIINRTKKVFVEFFEIEEARLLPEANIFTDLGLDSLDIVDLIVALQNQFGIKIRSEEDVRNIRTLQDLYQFIAAVMAREAAKKH